MVSDAFQSNTLLILIIIYEAQGSRNALVLFSFCVGCTNGFEIAIGQDGKQSAICDTGEKEKDCLIFEV